MIAKSFKCEILCFFESLYYVNDNAKLYQIIIRQESV